MSHNGSHIAAPTVAVAYHSGFGHTAVLADAVAAGARDGGAHVTVVPVDAMTDQSWDVLDGADGDRVRQRDVHGQRVGGLSVVRRTDRADDA